MLRPLIATLALCTWTMPVWGQLVFETERVEHLASPGESSFEAHFPFTNEGDAVVTVTATRSTCGCTVPELGKKVYEPGEEGVVRAIFTYGQRTGTQQKSIVVATDQGTHRLSLQVTIPLKWTVEPRIQTWKTSETPSAKRIVVQFDSITPQAVELAEYPEDAFEAVSRWDEEAQTFSIAFTPLSLESGRVQRASIDVTLANGSVESIPIYLRVY